MTDSNQQNQNHSLHSETVAANRLGISRITLLRKRQNREIDFYRIGTRVLYSDAHLAKFLEKVERKAK